MTRTGDDGDPGGTVLAADALVVFGITGDLARKMTLPSLYLLERRGLLDCPVIGVAVDDWSTERLRDHARASIDAAGVQLDEDVFGRFAAKLSYLPRRLRRPGHLRPCASRTGRSEDAGLLPRDPTLPVRAGRRRALAGRAHGGFESGAGEAVRARPRLRTGAERATARTGRRITALPHRPLPGEARSGGHPLPALCQHGARAAVEPAVRLLGADHDGRGLRRGGPRPFLRPRRSLAGRRPEPPAAGAGHGCDGAADRARRGRDQRPQARRVRRHGGGRSGALRARSVQGAIST